MAGYVRRDVRKENSVMRAGAAKKMLQSWRACMHPRENDLVSCMTDSTLAQLRSHPLITQNAIVE